MVFFSMTFCSGVLSASLPVRSTGMWIQIWAMERLAHQSRARRLAVCKSTQWPRALRKGDAHLLRQVPRGGDDVGPHFPAILVPARPFTTSSSCQSCVGERLTCACMQMTHCSYAEDVRKEMTRPSIIMPPTE